MAMPPPGPGWHEAPKPEKGQYTTEVVLAMVVVFVVASVIIGLFMYVIIPKPIGGSCPCDPQVQFAQPQVVDDNVWEIQVAGVSEARDLWRWEAVLLKNETLVERMRPLADGNSGNITFVDIEGEDTLNTGDLFTITSDSGGKYRLVVIWRDSGNERGRVEWWT